MAIASQALRLAAVRARDDGGFRAFFAREYAGLVRALVPTAGSVAAAEELVQEAMVRALERWPAVRGFDSPAGYVYTIAVNLHRRSLRRGVRRLLPGPPAASALDEDVARRSDLAAAVARLPEAQRHALLLVDVLGVDATTAGRLLGIEPVSVRSRLSRARATLRQDLER